MSAPLIWNQVTLHRFGSVHFFAVSIQSKKNYLTVSYYALHYHLIIDDINLHHRSINYALSTQAILMKSCARMIIWGKIPTQKKNPKKRGEVQKKRGERGMKNKKTNEKKMRENKKGKKNKKKEYEKRGNETNWGETWWKKITPPHLIGNRWRHGCRLPGGVPVRRPGSDEGEKKNKESIIWNFDGETGCRSIQYISAATMIWTYDNYGGRRKSLKPPQKKDNTCILESDSDRHTK